MTNIETERLRMREVTEKDAGFILEMLNEPEYIRNVADRGVRTEAAAKDYIRQKFIPSYTQFGFGFYLVELKETSAPIGVCGLMKREMLEHVDIGYSVLARYSRRGYASEAAVAMMHHGREVLGIPQIVGVTASDNLVSIRMLEKLGLRFDRIIDLPGYEGPSKLFV